MRSSSVRLLAASSSASRRLASRPAALPPPSLGLAALRVLASRLVELPLLLRGLGPVAFVLGAAWRPPFLRRFRWSPWTSKPRPRFPRSARRPARHRRERPRRSLLRGRAGFSGSAFHVPWLRPAAGRFLARGRVLLLPRLRGGGPGRRGCAWLLRLAAVIFAAPGRSSAACLLPRPRGKVSSPGAGRAGFIGWRAVSSAWARAVLRLPRPRGGRLRFGLGAGRASASSASRRAVSSVWRGRAWLPGLRRRPCR
jgi:hypothetical protein